MINPSVFIDNLTDLGFSSASGVPCSFLTPLINAFIDDARINYSIAANEGDAVAYAAGASAAGKATIVMMQNSGLGNAVNPLTSLTEIFHIPILLIITLRGDPNLKDEPQHELMGTITTDLLDLMNIKWDWFPTNDDEVRSALLHAQQCMQEQERPFALIMRKGSVATQDVNNKIIATNNSSFPVQHGNAVSVISNWNDNKDNRPSRTIALQRIIERTDPAKCIIIATTGHTGRELFALNDRNNHLYMVGSLGCVSSFALGFSSAHPDLKTIVIDGDGSALMRLGNFATLGAYGSGNLVHILLDNEIHASTGGQYTVSPGVSFARIATAVGYQAAYEGDRLNLIDEILRHDDSAIIGPKFLHLKISPHTPTGLPRPTLTPDQTLKRLQSAMGLSHV